MQILIPESRVDVLASADVLVCGGGCAGIAAAVSASRHGASVVLLERWPTIGGMATNALVNGWHRSDREKVVINGLVDHIPLGMCLNSRIPNLAVVGRCASSTHEAHSSVRVQTHGMVMGQGVGTAAALALENGRELGQSDLPALQAALRADGVYLSDVPTAGTNA